jgi:anti-anti-sigma factor
VLEVRCRADHEAIVFELQGDICESTAALLDRCLDAAFEIDAASVVVDLTDVDVFGEAGLKVLSETRERCAATGRTFELRSAYPTTASILDLFEWGGMGAARATAKQLILAVDLRAAQN